MYYMAISALGGTAFKRFVLPCRPVDKLIDNTEIAVPPRGGLSYNSYFLNCFLTVTAPDVIAFRST